MITSIDPDLNVAAYVLCNRSNTDVEATVLILEYLVELDDATDDIPA